MVAVASTVRDQHGRVVVGATVSIYDTAGVLVTTATTNSLGAWSATLDPGSYQALIRKAADFETRPLKVCDEDEDDDAVERTVLDQYGRPVPAALVWIRDPDDSSLIDLAAGNPVLTDSTGRWTAVLDAGTYDLMITKGAATLSRSLYVCGDPVPESFYILAETSDVITTESGDRLVYQ